MNYIENSKEELIQKIQELEQENQLFKMSGDILNNIATGIVFIKNQQLIWANKKAQNFYRFIFEIDIENDISKFGLDKESSPILAQGFHFINEFKHVKRSTEIIWCKFVGKAVNPNNLNEGIVWIIEEITERKKAEMAIKNYQEKLLNTINGTNAGIWEWNIQTGDTIFNEKWADIIGYSLDELEPLGIETWMSLMHPDDLLKSKELIGKHFKKESEYYSFDYRMKHKDGSWVWVFDQGKVLEWDEFGQPVKMFGTHINISERKKFEEIIKLQNEKLNALNASKDKFFSIISHDLKSPFNGFLSLTYIMSQDLVSLEEMREFSKKLNTSANNVYKLLENLLEWSTVQIGTIDFKPEIIDISKLIKLNIYLLNEYSDAKNIELINNSSGKLECLADHKMIATVLRNLLTNAIKFTPKNGKVIISVENKELEILVSIQDSGIGMNSTLINKLFKIDEKVSRPGTNGEKSTGLGLLLCKEFIEKNKGNIWAESIEDKGSTFYFSLPKS